MFVYVDSSDESDVEILTRDNDTTVRYTNQPAVDKRTGNEIPGASQTRSDLPDWSGWNVHRLDWSATQSTWYMDGSLVANSTYSVPQKPSGVIINMWSDGGVWSGIMPVGGVAELQLQWVEVLFNTSGSRDGPKTSSRSGGGTKKRSILGKRKASKNCKVVCAVDGVNRVGFPEVRFTADARSTKDSRYMMLNVVVIAFWVAIFTQI
jgi:beta-glucanase (GH16 family)